MAKRSKLTPVVTDTGIYRSIRFRPTSADQAKEQLPLLRAAFQPQSLESVLAHYESWAKEFADDENNGGTAATEAIRADARHITNDIFFVRKAVECGNAKHATWHGMYLGKHIERLEIRLGGHEANATTGRKTRKASRGANEAKQTASADRDNEIRAAVKEKKTANPRLSFHAAGVLLAKQHIAGVRPNGTPIPEAGWSWGKIKNAIRGMKKSEKIVG